MKIYFFTETRADVMDFANPADEPTNVVASFELAAGQSTFSPRYALEDGQLVDKFPGKTDEEVAVALQQAEAAKAAELAAANAQ